MLFVSICWNLQKNIEKSKKTVDKQRRLWYTIITERNGGTDQWYSKSFDDGQSGLGIDPGKLMEKDGG